MRAHLAPLLAGLTAASLAFTAAVGPTAAAAGHARRAASGPVHGGTLYIATQTDIPSLDPAVGVDTESLQYVDAIFAQLVTYDSTSLKIIPDLASSWSYNAAQTQVTFHLRKTAFSNGDPLTAADVVFTLTRVINPKTAATLAGPFMDIVGAQAYANGKAKSVSGLVAVNPSTVRIDLVKPEPYLLDALASGTGSILDPKVVNQYGTAHISQHPVGAGPFELQSWIPGRKLVLVRNPHYWQPGVPYLNKVVLQIGVSTSTQFLEFQQHKLDIVGGDLIDAMQLDSSTYLSVLSNPTLKKDYLSNTALEVYALYLNTLVKPFNNLKVRQAVMYALDRQQLVRILNGRAQVANQLLPPALGGYDKSLPPIPYDPAKAKALLKASGVPKSELTVPLITLNDPISIDESEALQAQLQAVGFKVTVKPQALSTYLNSIESKTAAPMSYGFWIDDYPDAEDFLFNQYYAPNPGGFDIDFWSNPVSNKLIAEADAGTNPALRVKQYEQAQRIILENAPAIPMFYGEMDLLKQPNVHPGQTWFYLHPSLPIQLWYLWKS